MPYLFLSHIVFAFSIVTLTLLVLLVGLILIILVATVLKEPKEGEDKPVNYVFHHILRDVGIAFIVAAIVTVAYGSILDFHRVSDAISMMIGEDVPQSVWDSAKTQIFERSVFRGNYEARWVVQIDGSLPPDQAILKTRFSYDLYGLKPQPSVYTVRQELENIHLRSADGRLPRFDSVLIADKMYTGDELNPMVKDGLLTLPPVNLNAWKKTDARSELSENSGIRIIFERTEIINIPGSYNVVLSELTKDITLEIEHPDSVRHELKEWFERGSQGFKFLGGWYYKLNGIVLPGQSISVHFWRIDKPDPTSHVPLNPTKKTRYKKAATL